MSDEVKQLIEEARSLYVNARTGVWIRDTEEADLAYRLVAALEHAE